MHRTLTNTEQYAHKIHWWVRLFGIVWLASVVLAVVGGIAFGVMIADQRAALSTSSSSNSLYTACMSNPNTTYSDCQRLR
jgi:hypothetical protein